MRTRNEETLISVNNVNNHTSDSQHNSPAAASTTARFMMQSLPHFCLVKAWFSAENSEQSNRMPRHVEQCSNAHQVKPLLHDVVGTRTVEQ